MKLKNILAGIFVAGILMGCSSPQRITLKDNTSIDTRDDVRFNKKTGFYEYKNSNGRKSQVNADSIFKIEEL